ncbi:MAG: hypothetical protein H7095_07040 [Pseudopedobacter sp.]|nr:hypothetical protein [Deinococcales bacterium]
MNWPRLLAALVAGFGTALASYGAIYNHFVPRSKNPDPQLAFNLIPLELLLGAVVGVLVFRLYSRKLENPHGEREDIRLRMLYRLAHRSKGVVQLSDLERTPLESVEVLNLLKVLEGQGKARDLGDGRYQLS